VSKEIERTALEGEVVYSVEDHLRMTITPEDLARVDEFMIHLNKLCAKLGVPSGSTVIDGSVVEPVTDPTRLIEGEQ
jgi:hypothetical protein